MTKEELTLERFATELQTLGSTGISDEARDVAHRCLIDAIACASVGIATPAYQHSRDALQDLFKTNSATATAWFQRAKHSFLEAVYLNATAVSAHDLDDGHRQASGHPGSAVIPAVLAEVESERIQAASILDAIVIGYEAAVRLAGARTTSRVLTLATGRWASFAAAAVSSWLAGDDEATMANALAHAGSMAPHLIPPDQRRTDGLKETTAWSVTAGLIAARLARAGIPGPTYLLERHPDYDVDSLDFVAVGPAPAILGTYFKPYGCCRWIHPAIDAALALKARHDVDSSMITFIEVTTFERSLTLSNKTMPASLEEAHYSFPFCIALALVSGPEGLLPIEDALLRRKDVIELAERIELRTDARYDQAFPSTTPAHVRIETPSGALEMEVDAARGDPTLPLSAHALESKHRRLLTRSLGEYGNTLLATLESHGDDHWLLLDALRSSTPAEAAV